MRGGGPFGGTYPQPQVGVAPRAGISARGLRLIGLMQRSNASLGQQLVLHLSAMPAARVLSAQPATPDLMPHVGLVRHVESDELLGRMHRFTPAALEEGAVPSGESSLYAHVAGQLPLIFRQSPERIIAERFAEAIELSGWISTTVEAVAALCACPVEQASRILQKLQREIAPAGLFARSLAECLRLQAQDEGLLDAGMAQILDNLPLVAQGRLDQLAADCGLSAAVLSERLARMRRFDPKPGSRFDQSATRFCFGPDLVLHSEKTGWALELCGATLPRLSLADQPGDPAQIREVQWWIDAIESRNQRLLEVARCITRHQLGYLSGASPRPVPLAVGQIAAESGLHISSVGRIAAATTLQSTRGLLSLRALMPGRSTAHSELTTAALRQRLLDLITAEAKLLSDAAIAAVLAGEGIHLSGRAIAQHRAALGIGSSRRRRQ